MKTYECKDESWEVMRIEAETPREAAQKYVAGGDWGDIESTIWVDVDVREADKDESDEEDDNDEWTHSYTIAVDPDEPECEEYAGHDWVQPDWIRESWVQGNGGGVIVEYACRHCGCARIEDSWAQNPETGEQGLCSTSYEQDKYTEDFVVRGEEDAEKDFEDFAAPSKKEMKEFLAKRGRLFRDAYREKMAELVTWCDCGEACEEDEELCQSCQEKEETEEAQA